MSVLDAILITRCALDYQREIHWGSQKFTRVRIVVRNAPRFFVKLAGIIFSAGATRLRA